MKVSYNEVTKPYFDNNSHNIKLSASPDIPAPYEKLSDKFKDVNDNFRSIVIKAGNLKLDATGKEILEFLDTIDEAQQLLVEQKKLKHEIAKLTIDKAVKTGLLRADERDVYIKLATASLDVTMEVIQARKQDEIELTDLLKLSGHQLYMDGKLERLKELSEHHFKLKYNELENFNWRGISETRDLKAAPEIPENELEGLLQLSAKQLYMDGKLERLKELDINVFKLKYKEFFNVDYPF